MELLLGGKLASFNCNGRHLLYILHLTQEVQELPEPPPNNDSDQPRVVPDRPPSSAPDLFEFCAELHDINMSPPNNPTMPLTVVCGLIQVPTSLDQVVPESTVTDSLLPPPKLNPANL